ncbi:MAG: hypothetical protein MNPFHGCM_03210 [Gemmatimonadaceae bacterium]|nr:hypothetical protein [Gemmatimonadaceae bacterium]
MIRLGSFDPAVSPAAREEYLRRVEEATRVRISDLADGSDRIALVPLQTDAQQPMSVTDIQQGLAAAGFFPSGAIDGICGYRTLSAMRLFQEYVRTVEGLPMIPDGRFGATSQQQLRRWISARLTTRWEPTIRAWRTGPSGAGEYADWLNLLDRVKQRYLASPNRMLQLVSAFTRASDTRDVTRWDFSPDAIHLIGVRRQEASGKFDDIFVLLIKGLVFKFQGSTEPGSSTNPAGVPYLVQGQHDYHFGWHKKQYLALRPLHLDRGVLVVRSGDLRLDEADLDNGLEANASINVHWGGKGRTFDVKSWSEGCQVINGSAYVDDEDALIDCSTFAAANNGELAANPSRTRGAYNVLLDLVTAMSGDMSSNAVRYTLLVESDLDLAPSLKQRLIDARARAVAILA